MGILNVKKGIICQQVNCMGVMGCGLALAIRNKWPIVYVSYKKQIHKAGLGKIQLVRVDDDLFVGNLFAQYRYGREKCHTNYQAMKTCLEKVLLGRNSQLKRLHPIQNGVWKRWW